MQNSAKVTTNRQAAHIFWSFPKVSFYHTISSLLNHVDRSSSISPFQKVMLMCYSTYQMKIEDKCVCPWIRSLLSYRLPFLFLFSDSLKLKNKSDCTLLSTEFQHIELESHPWVETGSKLQCYGRDYQNMEHQPWPTEIIGFFGYWSISGGDQCSVCFQMQSHS